MNTTTLELDLPEAIYQQLERQPPQIRKTAIQLAIEAIADYVEQEAKLAAGREMLLRLPEEAQQYDDTPPHDLAARHDDYLYGEG
ncbi:MAG: hypothetical protein E3J21_23140 [Anaerolineales bacterium]|nr:MAG: hypothetical protein E3J21_23140 [Anaerolineales bacterium]